MTTTSSTTEDTNNNDKNEAIAEFRNLVLNLASSRPDVLSAKNRNALIQSAQNFLVVATAAETTATSGRSVEEDKNDSDDDDQDDNKEDQNDEEPAVLSNAEAREILANWKGTHRHARAVQIMYLCNQQGMEASTALDLCPPRLFMFFFMAVFFFADSHIVFFYYSGLFFLVQI